MSDQNIFKMKLHECCQISQELDVLRVPGGWVYREYVEVIGDRYDFMKLASSTFVPLSIEFKEMKNA